MLISPDVYFKTVFEWLSLVLHDSLFHLLLVICNFFNIAILQGSAATHLDYDGVFKCDFGTKFLLSLTVKEF